MLTPIAAALMIIAATGQDSSITVRAQAPEWRAAEEQEVRLSAYDIAPPELRLRAGVPVRLRFVNASEGRLSFFAPRFFDSALLRSGDSAQVPGGAVVLGPGERRTIALVPTAGRYGARSRNLLHRFLGMSADIVVE